MTTRITHPSRLRRHAAAAALAVPFDSTQPVEPEPGTGTDPAPETPEKVGEEAEPDPRERDYPALRTRGHLRLVSSTATPPG